jgi:UDP-2,3-diacylglucosamine pyrophosphatase LpxH
VPSSTLIYRRSGFGIAVSLCILAFTACEYEVPITSSPTRKVQEQVLGNWISRDGKEHLRVRRLDETIYIVYYDGDLFRAYHSDVADTPFVSVQDINSEDRKYAYVVWKLSDDSKQLILRSVNRDVIPKEKKDSTAVAKFLKDNAKNPDLFGEEIEFNKET